MWAAWNLHYMFVRPPARMLFVLGREQRWCEKSVKAHFNNVRACNSLCLNSFTVSKTKQQYFMNFFYSSVWIVIYNMDRLSYYSRVWLRSFILGLCLIGNFFSVIFREHYGSRTQYCSPPQLFHTELIIVLHTNNYVQVLAWTSVKQL